VVFAKTGIAIANIIAAITIATTNNIMMRLMSTASLPRAGLVSPPR
jgi:hypothetical protein